MNRNALMMLAGLVVAMLVVVLVSSRPGGGDIDEKVGSPVLPGIADRLNQLNELTLTQNETSVTLRREDDQWGVVERYSYPVDLTALTELTRAVAEAKLLERKTRKPENYTRLGFGEGALELQLGWQGESIVLLLGDESAGREGRYLRLPGAEDPDQVWLGSLNVDVEANPASWLATEVIDVEAESVQAVVFEHEGEVLRGERIEDSFVIQDLPEGAELKYSTVADSLARALANVRLQDVKPAADIDFSDASQATFELDGASTVRVTLVALGDEYWLHLPEREEQAPWAYQVNRFMYENLTKKMTDMIKEEAADTAVLGGAEAGSARQGSDSPDAS